MARLIREHDWPGTPLGHVRDWPTSLKSVVDLVLGSPVAMIVLWGPDLVQIYNDGYREVMAKKHPAGLGQPTRECWPEIWDFNAPIYEAVLKGESRSFTGQALTLERHGRPEEAWFDLSFSPLRDETGAVAGVLVVVIETTARMQAEASRAASDHRLQRVLETEALGVLFFDREGTVIGANDVFLRMTGYKRAEVASRTLTWRRMTPPEWVETSEREMERLHRTGHIGPYEKEYLLNDGSRKWMLFTGRDLGDGTVVEYCIDVTDRKRAEQARHESERRLRALIEGIPQLIWRAAGDGGWTWSSPQWSEHTGQSAGQGLGHGWLDAVHPDDRERVRSAWRSAAAEASFEIEHRIRCADGGYRWFQTRAAPTRDEAGRIVEWLGTSTDIDAVRRLQEHQRLLVSELQHRVRNTLAVIRSIAARTAETSETLADFATHLDGRISAFARVQTAVTRDPTRGIDLAELVSDELAAAMALEGEQVTLDGPEVTLLPRLAEDLGLAIHELATNALKHGALTSAVGRIAVGWRVEDGARPLLRLTWKESGVILTSNGGMRRGFGSDILDRLLPYQLDARTERTFEVDGLRCTILVPLA